MRIGLDVDQIEARLLDDRLMQALTVASRSISPVGDRSLIEPKGRNDGLQGTAVGKQRNDDDNQLSRLAQPFHHRSHLWLKVCPHTRQR